MIIRLKPEDYAKCSNIWDTEAQRELAQQCHAEIVSGNRAAYAYVVGGAFVGEISLVFDAGDPDYTIAGRRVYLSRLIVKPEFQRRGIGKKLVAFAADEAKKSGCREMSVGVNLDNYPALKLYVNAGFREILRADTDEYGAYVKLKRTL